jgi:uncharacterized protein YcnI
MPAVRRTRQLVVALLGALVVGVGLPGRAVAHVEVVPADSPAGAMQRYGIRVPTEKPIPTVRVEVEFPSGLRVLDIEASPGWQVTLQTESGGRPIGATWDGSSIPAGQFAEFGLRAQNPDGEAQLRWSVIQTYADGSEVQWIGPPDAEFPAATTRVRGGQVIQLLDPLAGASGVVAVCALVVSALAWRASRRSG